MIITVYINTMTELKFKTNVNCNHCIAKITPLLDAEHRISEWKVDIDNPDKIMTVKGDDINPGLVIETLAKAGYNAEPLG